MRNCLQQVLAELSATSFSGDCLQQVLAEIVCDRF